MILLDTNVLLRLYSGYEADLAPTAIPSTGCWSPLP